MAKMLTLIMSDHFREKLESFLIGLNALIARDYAKHYDNLEPKIVYPEEGIRYIRIVAEDGNGSGRYSHCFIDKSNGDVLKCAGWKTPAKHARGNIFSATNGLEGVGVHGANYIK